MATPTKPAAQPQPAIAPTATPPKQRVFLTADWRHLAMLNYEADPDLLRRWLPVGLSLDDWNGRHFVSVVGLMFERTRVYGLAMPFHRTFEEVNLRFYARREIGGEVRRGVVFIREIVPRRAVALLARALYNENYAAMPMSHAVIHNADETSVRYEWRHQDAAHSLAIRVPGDPTPLLDNTEEEFIAEHYWGYAAQRDGGTLEYEVEHPRWRVWRAPDGTATLNADAERLYGPEFAAALSGPPASAFLAEGSPIIVRKGVRIA